MFLFGKVSVLGAGLLGGSLARALKKAELAEKISVWSRSESSRAKCLQMPEVFDEVCNEANLSVKDADLLVVCTSTESIPQVLSQVSPYLKNGAIVTDVGSVKSSICVRCAEILDGKNAVFVGSHPMAGSEKNGVENSDAEIFDNRACFVTPFCNKNCEASSFALKIISQMWKAIGMHVCELSPQEHDAIVARISHLPHLSSGLLCAIAEKSKKTSSGDIRNFAGPGFRDSTRVSSGSPEIWLSIVRDNKDEILKSLKEFSAELAELQKSVENSDDESVLKFLKNAKSFRDALGDFSNLK